MCRILIPLIFYAAFLFPFCIILEADGPEKSARKEMCGDPKTYFGYLKYTIKPACWLTSPIKEK